MIENKKRYIKVLEVKAKILGLKNTLGGIICGLDNTREYGSEIDNIAMQTIQNEADEIANGNNNNNDQKTE